jgi:type I restriction enzyme S subunit
MVPKGWTSTRLGTAFSSRRERGKSGLPTLSVTLNDGLVERSSLDRKTDTNLLAEQHLSVKTGDIAYNMMRMWQGASGLSDREGIVSPAYVVLQPNKTVHPAYAAYLFKSPKMIHSFWAFSYGLTDDRLRLYFKDFSAIPVTLPPLEEQQRIADILRTWDRAIETTTALIQTSRAQKSALLQQLLTEQMRRAHFRSEWSPTTIGDIAEIIVSNVDKKSSADELPVRLCNYTDVYKRNKIETHQDFMAATATESQVQRFALRVNDVLITKDSETPDDIAVPSIVRSTAPDLLCGYHLAIIRPKACVIGAFLKFYFELKATRNYFFSRANGATRFGLGVSAIEEAPLRIPPIDEQVVISSILEAAEAEIEGYLSLLESLKTERSALMQKLLSGETRVSLASAPKERANA